MFILVGRKFPGPKMRVRSEPSSGSSHSGWLSRTSDPCLSAGFTAAGPIPLGRDDPSSAAPATNLTHRFLFQLGEAFIFFLDCYNPSSYSSQPLSTVTKVNVILNLHRVTCKGLFSYPGGLTKDVLPSSKVVLRGHFPSWSLPLLLSAA